MIILEVILLSYFAFVILYALFFSVAALFYKKKVRKGDYLPTFCILIPAYKEDAVIVETAKKTLTQAYPESYFSVVVIADSLQEKTMTLLRGLPIRIIEVTFENSTKVRALNSALTLLPDLFDYVVILDADNVMAPDFLQTVSNHIQLNTPGAVQGQRKPKNDQTILAFLDGLSEAINNHIYRQGSFAAGLSSSISGSGFVVSYPLLKEKLSGIQSVGGFDRELELQFLLSGIKVEYLKEAVVYDEKVSRVGTFENQRKRWIASQYIYLSKYFRHGIRALLRGDIAFFNSAILRNIQLPRLLNLGLLSLLTVGLYFFKGSLSVGYMIWPIFFFINALAIAIAIPGSYYSLRMVRSILSLPGLFLKMFSLLFKLKGADRKFIHTPHEI